MKKHCMLDLETMGTTPGCAILSIGAVGFTDRGLFKGAEYSFKRNVTLSSCLDAGLRVDASTERWWSEQSAEARAALLDPEPVVLFNALSDFHVWYHTHKFEHIWSHGAAADIVWLEAAYRAAGLSLPWHYRDSRDTRTLWDLDPGLERTVPTVEHCALQDAAAQAEDVVKVLRVLAH